MAGVEKVLGCMMCNTKLSGGVSGLRDRNKEAVILIGNHSGDWWCSRVLFSISRDLSGETSSVFLNAHIVSLRFKVFGVDASLYASCWCQIELKCRAVLL